jgi:hypothetical protein
MPYNTFTLDRVRADFGITVQTGFDLFGHIPPTPVSASLAETLQEQRPLALTVNTEKARSEWLIAPLLAEVWRRGRGRVALFSGVSFPVDPEADLTGVCDFILGRPPQLDYVTNPVMMITEAKNESIMGGLGQCAASMVAALRFNARRNSDIRTIYGCVTNGGEWKFLRLQDTTLDIDMQQYLIDTPDRILGIILHFVGLAPAGAPAAA